MRRIPTEPTLGGVKPALVNGTANLKGEPVKPYDWEADGCFVWKHPVDLLMAGEDDPAVLSATMAAHLSELAVQTDGSAQNLHAALRRLEESL